MYVEHVLVRVPELDADVGVALGAEPVLVIELGQAGHERAGARLFAIYSVRVTTPPPPHPRPI
jgi:hypothetical protein